MDFRHNTVLKEHYAFFVADRDAQVRGGEHGFYVRDTRVLSRYAWRWLSIDGAEPQTLLVDAPRPDLLHAHYARIEGPAQTLALRRTLRAHAAGFTDTLEVANASQERRSLSVELAVAGDFADVFEVRGWPAIERAPAVAEAGGRELTLRHTATDGVACAVHLRFDALAATHPDGAEWELSLAPGERVTLSVAVDVDHPLDEPPHGAIPYADWRASFAHLPAAPEPAALRRAIDDLRGLLLFTAEGPVLAAGIPWYVATFGRDALLGAHLLLPHRPDVAAGTLRHLARHQGRRRDATSFEAPGKIAHELRFGELARTGRVPHRAFYGTVDATPLFLTLLEAHRAATGELDLVRELRPAWESALAWIVGEGDLDGDGFLQYVPTPEGNGQGWKDSNDSMGHADGELATGPIAVAEAQGYAYAAFRAAASWSARLGDADAASAWTARAEALRTRFHEAFWLDDLGTYAMALDGDKRPLRVRNSDAGHLLWSGIVPEAYAARLVATLLGPELWSGWGIRTLGTGAARYNPVSYHNGSVWPHDTALAAAGFARYGFHTEARRVRDALFALAASQEDRRLPELVAGYERDDGPPVPYPVACRPQAWDAAALVHVLAFDGGDAST
ncbi:MAG: glycogen debranching N-terminal domain-containing protein [Trueperaceae bacterium]|nr:glycogen debranching N-terminal domain-containing protein [Trueperaceae bacterium]